MAFCSELLKVLVQAGYFSPVNF